MIQINRQVLIFVSASFLVGCVSFGPSFEPANSVTPSLANSIAQSSNAEAYNNRGLAKYELGDKKGAIADYNEAIRLNPNFAEAYNNRGLAKSDLGDKKGEIADYNEAIRLNPTFALAYNNRGVAKSELGDKQGAIADFRESARLFQQQGNAADYEDAQNRIRKLGG